MIELTEDRFEKLMKSCKQDYCSYLELFFVESERVVARFAGNNLVVLFTNKRIIYFYFPMEEKANKIFREYRFVAYKSIQHYSIMTGNKNTIIGFEISFADTKPLSISVISHQTASELMELINRCIL